jgi:membrane protein YdbS with pleckstrin-like domain
MSSRLFTNNQIDITEIPDTSQIIYIGLKTSYKSVMNIRTVIFLLILVAATGVTLYINTLLTTMFLYIAAPAFIIAATLFIALNIKMFNYMGYAVRENDILFRKGFIWRKTIAVPFNRIQHLEVKQGVLSKMFKVSTVVIFTAGGNTGDLTIPGIAPEESEKIRAFVMDKISKNE